MDMNPAAPFSYSRVPSQDTQSIEAKAEAVEEKLEEEAETQVWLQEAMAQVAALQQYGVICMVLSGFAFSGLASLDHKQIKMDLDFQVGGIHAGSTIVFLLALSMALCISCGLCATLIFTLCSIFGAVAVSHGNQSGFMAFMERTGPIRVKAFRAFKSALVTMLTTIVLFLLTKLPIALVFPVVLPVVMIGGGTCWCASQVMSVAEEEFGHGSMAAYHQPGIVGKENDGQDMESDEDNLI